MKDDLVNMILPFRKSTGLEQNIVLVHGNSSSSSCWDLLFQNEIAEKYRLIAVDMPGHGNAPWSKNPDIDYCLPALNQRLVDAAQSLKLVDALYVGWSLGAHVLMEDLDSLPSAAGVMIFGAPPTGFPLQGFSGMPSAAFKASPSTEEIEQHLATLVHKNTVDTTIFRQDFSRTDPKFRSAFGTSIAQGHFRNELNTVQNFNKPLAVIHGAHDVHVNLEYLQNVKIKNLWREKIQIIPDAGHALQWDAPAEFSQLLNEFAEFTQHA